MRTSVACIIRGDMLKACSIHSTIHIFSESAGQALRKKYQNLTTPLKYSAGFDDSDAPLGVEDIFVEVRLQEYTTEFVPENISYQALREKETNFQPREAIPLDELFGDLDKCVHNETDAQNESLADGTTADGLSTPMHLHSKTKEPTTVLLMGKSGFGKTMLVYHMAHQWAKGNLWPCIKYLFTVKLNEFRPNEKWSLVDLLLGDLGMSESMKVACIEEIRANSERVVILIDGVEELDEFEFCPKRIRHNNGEVDLPTLISSIIGDTALPGAKIIATSRPTQHTPVKACDRIVQLCGFTSDEAHEFVRKIADTKEEEQLIIKSIDGNSLLTSLCRVPLECNVICSVLLNSLDCDDDRQRLNVNTTTSLFVQVTEQIASKRHPGLKCSDEEPESDQLFDIIDTPLKKHADLAVYGLTSSPPRAIFYEDELVKFGLDETDRKCGFLVESQTKDPCVKGAKRPCWMFSHTILYEFLGAVGVLRSGGKVWEFLGRNSHVDQVKNIVCFLAGLLEDSRQTYFVERLVPGGASLSSRHVITELTEKLCDDATTISAVYETQNVEMVDIVGSVIELGDLSTADARALAWVLDKEDYCITSLRYV